MEPLGEAGITPAEPVVAGSSGCWRLTYRVGFSGIAVGGGIKVSTDSDTDWGFPQFHDPTAADYMTATTSSLKAGLSILSEHSGGFLSHSLKVTIHGYPLEEGDEITIVYGDRSFGGTGSRAQSFAEERRYFRVHVDPTGDGGFAEVPHPPHLQIIGGSAARLSVIAPSQVVAGNSFSMVVRALDRFGNPSYEHDGAIHFESNEDIPNLPEEYVFRPGDQGVHRFDGITAPRPGLYRITVRDENNMIEGASNPILSLAQPDEFSLYWGDLHGQVKLAEKIPEYFRFGRDVSVLDFASHQRNDHEVSRSDWEKTKRAVREYNKPGDFVVFLGYEWSGQHLVGGDHNIYYLEDDRPIHRSGHEMVEDKSDADTDLTHITDLYEEFRGKNVLIIPHVGGRPANLAFHDPELEPVIEVHSTHGTFEWFLAEALKRGYKVGFVAGSDDYKLRLGGAYPGIDDRRFVRGGLTAVYARGLTRQSLFEALKARRCYGTTGERIILKTSADGRMMGDEYTTCSPPEISVQVFGTNGLEKVELFRGLEKIYEFPSAASSPSGRIKVVWGGASRKWSYSGVLWDGELRIENGSIASPEFMPLDRADENFREVTERGFKWRTFTCGDQDGASFEVNGEDAEIVVTYNCTPMATTTAGGGNRLCASMVQQDRGSFRLRVNELGLTPKVVDIGPVGRRISIRRLAEGAGLREADFQFVDQGFRSGVNSYWVRVVQSDGEMAWSSPICVNRP